MLDNIDVEGLGALDTVTGQLIGTAVVVLVAGLGVGGAIAGAGKSRNKPDLATKGFITMGVAVVAAVMLGGIGPAVNWGMNRGTDSLMPEAAGPSDVTVEKDAAAISCEQVSRELNGDGFVDPSDDPEPLEFARELVGPEYEDEPPLDDPWYANEVSVKSVAWYPDSAAGGCSEQNETVAECTEVEVEWWSRAGRHLDNLRLDTIEIGGDQCES